MQDTLYNSRVFEDLLYFVLPKLPVLETTCFVLGKQPAPEGGRAVTATCFSCRNTRILRAGGKKCYITEV